ncbi:hypothetical protein J6590_039670 [Homalodisca vitripennis]|nr:hypothetical protein J6590_039668 [Homalodisca vitripennis]KAG8248491.1 hypothetical protein J6590_039670 [Homalodisca vitripennis]
MKTVQVSLSDVVLFHLPTIAIHLLSTLRETLSAFMRRTGPPHATVEEQEIFEQLDNRQEYNAALTNILRYWAQLYYHTPQSTKSLQDCLALRPDDTLSSAYIELETAQNLSKLFELSLANTEKHPPRTSTVKTDLSPPPITVNNSGNMFTSSTPAAGQTIHVGVDNSAPSVTFASLGAVGQSNPMIYQLKMSSFLRSITSRIANRSCTARWEGNSGELLVKMEVYRWADIQTLPARDWWKYAIHRSQVLFFFFFL